MSIVETDFDLKIANLSFLSDINKFLLQISNKSPVLSEFIKNKIPKKDIFWLSELKSWEISKKWILEIADICIKAYDQVFFDHGDELLLDLTEKSAYIEFKKRVLENNL